MQTKNLAKIIALAFSEDKVFNDKTSDLSIPKNLQTSFVIKTREPIIFCGNEIIKQVYKQLKTFKKFRNSPLKLDFIAKDQQNLKAKSVIASGYGCARLIFASERVILNFIQHLSGIATQTQKYVKALNNPDIAILDTRKTLPAYRHLQKYAVLCGGGKNHRFDLSERILIKDNHLANNNLTIEQLVKKIRKKAKDLLIEIECDQHWQVVEAVKANVDIIMLDNMNNPQLLESIKTIRSANPKVIIEVSGGINLNNIKNYRELDIDCISIGSLTHGVKAVDIGLDIENHNLKPEFRR